MQEKFMRQDELSPDTRAFYGQVLDILEQARIPFLIGGAYALAQYTGIIRHTKDFDVFLHPSDCARALAACAVEGYQTELTFPHWLGKVYAADAFIDVIFSSGNGVAEVDDDWFTHAVPGEVLGHSVILCPPEEMIWSKAFVMERERYDGPDIAHLLRARASRLDWPRLLRRFGPHYSLLLINLILFHFIYPDQRSQIPEDILQTLLQRFHAERRNLDPAEHVCYGTLLSREQYLVDISSWGYQDARLLPRGPMTAYDIGTWTAAITGTPPKPVDGPGH